MLQYSFYGICIFSLAGFENKVLLLKISGATTPASDDIIVNTIAKTENEGAEALVTSLDIPREEWGETQAIIRK